MTEINNQKRAHRGLPFHRSQPSGSGNIGSGSYRDLQRFSREGANAAQMH